VEKAAPKLGMVMVINVDDDHNCDDGSGKKNV